MRRERRSAPRALGAGPAAVEGGLGVEVGEEGLEAGELVAHLGPQAVVDPDGLGDDLTLALGRAPGAELLAQLAESVLGRDDRADLLEIEPHQLLQLPDPPHASDVVVGVATSAARAVARRRQEAELLVVAKGAGGD